MDKVHVVASLGQSQLLRPTWVKAALRANDRLKVYLTLLQAAWTYADQPTSAPIDLTSEFASASTKATWLTELPGTAFCTGSVHCWNALPD